MKKSILKRGLAALTAALTASSLCAQVTTSSLAGRVTGTAGETVTGSAVIATHIPSGTTYGTVTDAGGFFTLQGMRPGGPYTVEISCLGYRTVIYKGLLLSLGETYSLDTVMEEDSEALTGAMVIATASSKFAATKTGASTNVSNEEMMSLPNSGHSIASLTRLSPYASGMSFAGSDGRSTNFTVDGANLNNNFGLSSSLPGGGTPISLDAIEEVQFVVAPYDVRQSDFVGGGINAVTKSGTNRFRGTAYAYYSDEGTRGNTLMGERIGDRGFEQDKTCGFTLGGPVIRDRLFFFVNCEVAKKPGQAVQWRITDARKVATLNKIADKLRNEYGYDPGSFTDYPGGVENMKVLVRVDWNISQAHKLNIRYNDTVNNQWNAPNGNSCDDNFRNKDYNRAGAVSQPFSYNMYSQQNNIWSVAGELNSRFTDRIANRLIGNYTSINDRRGSNSDYFPHIDIMTAVGEGSTEPDLSKGNFIPYTSLGYELFSYNNGVLNTVLNLQDNLTFYLGAHTVTAGVSFEHQMARNSYMRNGTGYYRFATAEDFLQGNLPVSFALTYGNNGVAAPAGIINYDQYGAYLQDEWKVTRNLRLSYGLRADMLAFDDGDLMTNNAIRAVDFGGRSVDTGRWPADRMQVSPRVGFNWNISGDNSLVIRGGSGLFRGRLPLVFFTNMPQNAGMIQTSVSKKDYSASFKDGAVVYPDEVLAALTKLNGGKTTGGHLVTDIEGYITTLGLDTTVTEADGQLQDPINGVDKDFHMPQVWKSSLAVDYTVPVSFPLTLTLEGMYNKTIWGTRLVNWNIDEDALTSRFSGPDKRLNYRDVTCNYGNTEAYVLTNAREGWGYTFNFSVAAEPVRELRLTASYTRTESKEISGMPGSNATSAYTGLASVDGPNFLGLQRSRYVTPDLFSANIVYYLESQGLHFNLFYTGCSAYGNSYTYSNDMNGDGIAYDLMYIPAARDELKFKSDADRDAFWSFLEQDRYLSGHKGGYAEAYAARSPFVHRFDLRVSKDFDFRVGATGHRVQVSASIDNIGNMVNSSWGVRKLAYNQSSGTGFISPLKYEGVDDSGVPSFSFNKVNGEYPAKTYTNCLIDTGECWKVLLGIRYCFN